MQRTLRVFGSGQPVVLVPGIQGRWEWMWPAVRALAERYRVSTFSLGAGTGAALFDAWADVIDRVADEAHGRVVVVGVSFGGLIAAYYAGRRPDRVSRLVLASTPSPRWSLDARSARYVKSPLRSLPLFAMRGASRLRSEVWTARPTWGSRLRFAAEHVGRTVVYPPWPPHMARYVRAWQGTDLCSCCPRITAPTLVITGEPSLDRVVPVASSLEWLSLLAEASHVTMNRTGHLGIVLRPSEFAGLVTDFVEDRDAKDRSRECDGRTVAGARQRPGPGRATRSAAR